MPKALRRNAVAVIVIAIAATVESGAATLPPGFREEKLIGSLNATCVEPLKDGRILLCEKQGIVHVYKAGIWLPDPMLKLDADFNEERGLLGIAVDPGFADNPYVYVYYTAKAPSVHNRVSRFKVSGDAVSGAEQVLIDLDPLGALRSGGWHNGGSIRFGKDGKLYVQTGNNTIQAYSQSMDNLLGKILRLNPDGSIPEDNPFYKTATGRNRAIWALGLRNPFGGDIDPASGRYLFQDVGDGSYEEIDEGVAGANYGYPKSEGKAATAPTGLTGTYHDPISGYNHGDGCAVTGAAFYAPAANAFGKAYEGAFFFADYCNGWIKYIDPAKPGTLNAFAANVPRPVFLRAGADGSLYYVCRGARAAGLSPGGAEDNASTADGSLYRIIGPVATALAQDVDHRPILAGPGAGLAIPAGRRRVVLRDAGGRPVWSYDRSASAEAEWATLPPNLESGILFPTYP